MPTIPGSGTLINNLGGPAGYGEITVARNDDGSSQFDVSQVFPGGLNFFGHNYTSLYVNTNGSISFNTGISTYTPTSITGGLTPMIAAFWGDVDTRTPAATGTDSAPIYVDLDTVNHVFTATWPGVNYYDQKGDKKDFFQIQLYDRGHGDFDIVFRYQNIQWTTGDVSGGSGGLGGQIAHAGYTAGDGAHFSELPASGTNAMLTLPTTLGNTSVNGLWVFPVRGEQTGAGFDTKVYPGQAAMGWIKDHTNLSWVAYYLAPAPSRVENSWLGHRAELEAQGWNIAPTYIGEQDPAAPGNLSHHPSGAKGIVDGNSAIKLLKQEGFAAGTIIYLDIESTQGVALSSATQDYIKAWCLTVSQAGYIPGVYCVFNQTSSIASLAPAPLWVVRDFASSPVPPVQDPNSFATYPTDDPSGSTYADAVAWQYRLTPTHTTTITLPNDVTVLGQPAAHSIVVDLNTVTLPSVISGNNGLDLLTGTSGNDFAFGLGGNDTINGLAGNDKIDGGAGFDTVMLSGANSAYTITPKGNGVFQVSGPDGVDLLSHIEKLSFGDSTSRILPTASRDFDGSGTSDIFLFNTNNNAASIWDTDAGAVRNSPLGLVPAVWTIATSGDFDGDGHADLLWRNSSTGVAQIWKMNDGNVVGTQSLGVVPATWKVLGVGDFNSDSHSDIVWRNDSNNVVQIWDMRDATLLSANSLGVVPSNWTLLGTGDFNGDGKSDLLWRNTDGAAQIWNMNDGALLGAPSLGVIPAVWKFGAIGDFNGDGRSDILWRNDSGVAQIWNMNNGTIQGTASLGVVPNVWSIAQTGDFNGDSKTDILWRNASGALQIWDMNNGTLLGKHDLGSVPDVWHVLA